MCQWNIGINRMLYKYGNDIQSVRSCHPLSQSCCMNTTTIPTMHCFMMMLYCCAVCCATELANDIISSRVAWSIYLNKSDVQLSGWRSTRGWVLIDTQVILRMLTICIILVTATFLIEYWIDRTMCCYWMRISNSVKELKLATWKKHGCCKCSHWGISPPCDERMSWLGPLSLVCTIIATPPPLYNLPLIKEATITIEVGKVVLICFWAQERGFNNLEIWPYMAHVVLGKHVISYPRHNGLIGL